jgi:hypothetical protein
VGSVSSTNMVIFGKANRHLLQHSTEKFQRNLVAFGIWLIPLAISTSVLRDYGPQPTVITPLQDRLFKIIDGFYKVTDEEVAAMVTEIRAEELTPYVSPELFRARKPVPPRE